MSLSHVQSLAAQIFTAVHGGQNLSDELSRVLAAEPALSAQDKGMLQDLAYGCQRFYGSLHFMLNRLLNKPVDNPLLYAHLLVALYQLNHTRNAPYAVVNETVRHIGKIGRGQYRSFANAILRRFLREREGLNKAVRFDETAKYNLPAWLKSSLQQQYPKHWHNIAAAFQMHPPLTLRVNRRHGNAEHYTALLQQSGIEAKILDDYAVRLNEAVPVQQLPQFAEGHVSVQDWGAQQAAYLLQPQDGERILDACAAPGGKTGHILEMADCALTALDIDPVRLQRVQDNLTRLSPKSGRLVGRPTVRRHSGRRALHRFRHHQTQSRHQMAAPPKRHRQNRTAAGNPARPPVADAQTRRPDALGNLLAVSRRKRAAMPKIPATPRRCATATRTNPLTQRQTGRILLCPHLQISKRIRKVQAAFVGWAFSAACCRCWPCPPHTRKASAARAWTAKS